MNFGVVHRVVVSKRTLLVCCCCILYSFDNRGRSLECESRGESHEYENWKWVFWSIQMEFFDTKWTHYFQWSCSLLGCETNQLLFSVSASYSSFTWGSKLLPQNIGFSKHTISRQFFALTCFKKRSKPPRANHKQSPPADKFPLFDYKVHFVI